MRFRLSSLLLTLVLVGIAAAWFVSRLPAAPYSGYFSRNGIRPLIHDLDPLVEVTGVSGNNGSNGNQFTFQSTNRLTSIRPITGDFVRTLRERLFIDMRAKGIKAEADFDASSSSGPWGFQLFFEEGRYRGVLTIRLLLKSGGGAELFENILVFPRD